MQPTTPTQAAANGTIATAKPQKTISFATAAAQYKSHLFADGGKNPQSDSYLEYLCAQFAKNLYRYNFDIIKVNNGQSEYGANYPVFGDFHHVSLNYCPNKSELEVHILDGAGQLCLRLPAFQFAHLQNENDFVEHFVFFGEFGYKPMNDPKKCFHSIRHRNGKENAFEKNPMREYFHELLTNQL